MERAAAASDFVPDSGLSDGGLSDSSVRAAEWRAHWRTVLAVAIGLASGYSLYQFSASQFILPWQAQFGWSRGQIALASNGLLLSAVLSPWVGRLFDRYGVRRLLIPAMILTGVGHLAMAQMSGSIAEYYAIFLCVQVIGMMTTGLAFTRVIVSRFVLSRGTALAVSRIGVALFGVVMPVMVHAVIADHGWRWAFVLMAAVTFLIGVPACWLGVKDAPRPGGVGARAGAPPLPGFIALIRTHPKILLICLAGALHYAPMGALLSQLQPLLMSKQILAADAAFAGGVFAGSVLLGTLLSGMLADRIWAPLVGCLFALGPLAGCVILLQDNLILWNVILAVILIGMAQGAEIDVVAYLTARYFGMSSFSAIYGLVMMATVIATFAAQVSIGFVFDRFGNYQVALQAAILLLASAAVCYLAMGRYPPPRDD